MRFTEAQREITREYDANPDGWHCFQGVDRDRCPTYHLYHNTDFWIIKFPSNLARQIGNGVVERGRVSPSDVRDIQKDPDSFGIRVISPETLIGMITQGRRATEPRVTTNEVPRQASDLATRHGIAFCINSPVRRLEVRHAPSAARRLDDAIRTEMFRGYS